MTSASENPILTEDGLVLGRTLKLDATLTTDACLL
jgi:hypothetical protein